MKIARTISLAYLGDDHKDDYLKFSDITLREAKEMEKLEAESADAFFETLKNKFITGKITNDETGNVEEVTKDNFEEVPISVLTKTIQELVGGIDENLG